ncbi:hypothetical protein DXG01_004348 [Tephrocybe rancida]|nr:hypothetical protein DXG01_004348 [Tephrocybe rancida]
MDHFGWTRTHGFFAIMGGFQVCHSDGTMAPFILDSNDLGPLLQNGDITISEQEIQDKSKGDILAKSLVLLQVSWFILQISARGFQHLAVTPLEIVTLAFAYLNFATYFCWWKKPLDVNLPVRITADYMWPHRDPDDPLSVSTSSNPEPTPVAEITPVGFERNGSSRNLFHATRRSIYDSNFVNVYSPETFGNCDIPKNL